MKYLEDRDLTLYQGDVREVLRSLPAESVHCVVTSPPYWGLRDYSAEGQLGLESTPEQYLANMVEVFREVRRVLRKDGTCWLNMGDSYASGFSCERRNIIGEGSPDASVKRGNRLSGGLKEKDLCMIPARLALALQADGWYLRSQIVWSKPNPMPESVTDRPTTSHEFVYLLAKSPRYFFDQEAVREPHSREWWNEAMTHPGNPDRMDGGSVTVRNGSAGRNLRSVWEIPTQPYPEAHFATYPEELVRRCILAGTSERGCCPECGAPWARELIAEAPDGRRAVIRGGKAYDEEGKPLMGDNMIDHGVRGSFNSAGEVLRRETSGWRCPCECGRNNAFRPIPCTVLDPFFGSGTTGLVARKHGRRTIGIELSESYCEPAARRLQQLSLLAEA